MKLAWGKKVSPAFRRRVIEISAELGCHPNDFMSCMAFESAETFSPSVINRVSGATGLIQFMPYTAPKLGTSTAKLAAMTAEEQLEYVRAYFKPYFGKLRTIDDLYMAILWPRAVGKSSSYVLFDAATGSKTQKAYLQNKGLDANKDGHVTKAEAAKQPRLKLQRGLTSQFAIEVRDTDDVPDPADDAPDVPTVPEDEQHDAPAIAPETAPEGFKVRGDRVTWFIQYHLKRMNYYASFLDGGPGGKTFGATTAFLTDWDERYGEIEPPKSNGDWAEIKASLYREVTTADAEGFKRPVSAARERLDPEVVDEVAPEAKTQRRGFLATIWAAIVTFFGGLMSTVSTYVGNAWNWITGNKDSLPDQVTDPGWLSWAFGKIGALPPAVWLFVGAGVLGFVAFGLLKTLKQTTDAVRTGAR